MANKRTFYATYAVGIAPESTNNFSVIKGLQSVGMTTTFNIEQVFEIGKLATYANIEAVPDVEISCTKVLDGWPLMYHMATYGAVAGTLVARSAKRCNMSLAVFSDTVSDTADAANQLSQCILSGLYFSSAAYNFPVDGNFTEDVSFVGNNKRWVSSGFTFTSGLATGHAPSYNLGVARRQHFDMYTSRFPQDIPGISASGTYGRDGDGYSATVFQRISTSVNLNRDQLFELGRRGPYFRFAQFPVEVSTEIQTLALGGGDGIAADEEAVSNTSDRYIKLVTTEGTTVDLGYYNRLTNCQTSGGDAGGNGSNVTVTYQYRTFNDFLVQHSADPTTGLRP